MEIKKNTTTTWIGEGQIKLVQSLHCLDGVEENEINNGKSNTIWKSPFSYTFQTAILHPSSLR